MPLDALNLANFTKWSNTLKQFVGNLPTNCLSVFDHFMGLALRHIKPCQISNIPIRRKIPIFLRTIFTFFLIKLTGNQNTRFCFYKQQFYKQRQAEIGKKIKQKLRNILRLNFCYLTIIGILHPRYNTKIIRNILKKCTKNK